MSSGISSGSGNSSRMDNDKQQAINNKQWWIDEEGSGISDMILFTTSYKLQARYCT